MKDPRKIIRAWWGGLSLKRKVQFRIAEACLLCAVFSALTALAITDTSYARPIATLIGMLYFAGVATALALDAWRKWRALHNPLFYLAAVRHDLGKEAGHEQRLDV